VAEFVGEDMVYVQKGQKLDRAEGKSGYVYLNPNELDKVLYSRRVMYLVVERFLLPRRKYFPKTGFGSKVHTSSGSNEEKKERPRSLSLPAHIGRPTHCFSLI
jgi:hypothetical protein